MKRLFLFSILFVCGLASFAQEQNKLRLIGFNVGGTGSFIPFDRNVASSSLNLHHMWSVSPHFYANGEINFNYNITQWTDWYYEDYGGDPLPATASDYEFSIGGSFSLGYYADLTKRITFLFPIRLYTAYGELRSKSYGFFGEERIDLSNLILASVSFHPGILVHMNSKWGFSLQRNMAEFAKTFYSSPNISEWGSTHSLTYNLNLFRPQGYRMGIFMNL
ncbi:MAG: hypothetical protein AAFY71_23575 [Bacteroidota bacterium]